MHDTEDLASVTIAMEYLMNLILLTTPINVLFILIRWVFSSYMANLFSATYHGLYLRNVQVQKSALPATYSENKDY